MSVLAETLSLVLLAAAAVAAASALVAVLGLRGALRGSDGALYAIAAPAAAGQPEHFFLGLQGLLRSPLRRLRDGQPWVSLEFAGRGREVRAQIWIPHGEQELVESLLRAAYPGIQLSPLTEHSATAPIRAQADFGLARWSGLPIRTTFEGEPLSSLFATLARAERGEVLALELLVRPASSRWQSAALVEAQHLRNGPRPSLLPAIYRDPKPTQFELARAKAMEEKAAASGFECVLRLGVATERRERARELMRSVAASLRLFEGPNGFRLGRIRLGARDGKIGEPRRFPLGGGFILTTRELAALWHLPKEAVPYFEISHSAMLMPPASATRGERVVGVSTSTDGGRPIGLSTADSRLHLHLLGPTGTGKTTAMLNLAVQDVAAGRGVGVLDPKGDLVRGVLERIPRARLGDVVLISPEDRDFSVGINPLELTAEDDLDLVAENALTIFKRIYERFWGMRTDDVLKAALRTLLRKPNSTLAHIPFLLTDSAFRQEATTSLDDLGLASFWRWYEELSDSQRTEAIGPVLNKLNDFLVRPRLRRLLCQPRSSVDLRDVVDSGKILLADLSIGRWGESAAELAGSFLVAKLWQAVLARAAIAEDERRDFFLYLDEFQHFRGIGGPFADALAEARSLRLSLTIANQHLGQLSRELREAIGSNARSRGVFQCGQDDASYLAHEFAPLDANALMSLPRFEMAARLSIGGETSRTFTLRTLPPADAADPAVAVMARAGSLERYGRPLEMIDAELRAALAPKTAAPVDRAEVGWQEKAPVRAVSRVMRVTGAEATRKTR